MRDPMKRWPKGTWMRLQSKEILRAFIANRGISHSTLGRWAKCSPGFISQLASPTQPKNSCTPELAERIAEALNVPLEALFVPNGPSVGSTATTNLRTPA
jgi:hypothetical protein